MTLIPGLRNLITDVAGLSVGHAEDHALKSGTTVLVGERPFVAAVDVMGGAPGTRETDLLAPDKTTSEVDALFLSGGSAFGLDAGSGIVDGLYADGRGFAVGSAKVPLVPGAILFDLLNGGDKAWDVNPYRDLGRAAYEARNIDFELGTIGAGVGALTGAHKGGLGSASFVLENGITVGALVAVNPFGSVTTPNSPHFWAAPFEINDEFGGMGPDPRPNLCGQKMNLKSDGFNARGNTTIAIVATDAVLTKSQAKRMAIAAQDGIGRAIVPSHTPFDGDLIFAVSTGIGEREVSSPTDLMEIGSAAAHCLARAIARGVYHARSTDDDLLQCWSAISG
ncbi:P1 family peptidase [Cochlodiniinecator piscidefendens]|uniref:P1 family peptidase n=1 Tax=Cochlodiniinecator piscidefendens TaxID=2715756 RepID=UPI0014097D44|nr:P1 family peptidase [Cochlodiniinecator piscidefendens]